MNVKLAFACAVIAVSSARAQEVFNPADLGTAPLTREQTDRKNVLDYGLSSSNSFDDNGNVSGRSRKNNFMSTLQPQASILVSRPKMEARIYYGPGFTYSTDTANRIGVSHMLGGELTYSFTKRWSMHLRESFLLSSNAIDSVRAAQELPELGILERPGDALVGANVHRRVEQVGAETAYRLSKHTSVGLGTTFSNGKYERLEQSSSTAQPFGTQSWSAHAFFSQQLTPSYSVGVNYIAQNFSSREGKLSTLTHGLLGFATWSLRHNIQLSLFAGPEYSQIDNSLASNLTTMVYARHTSLSAGSSFAWRGEQNGLSASFIQRVSDSGVSAVGAVEARILNVQAQRHLTARSSVNIFVSYFSNTQLVAFAPDLSPDSLLTGAGYSRSLSPHLNLDIFAFRQEFSRDVSPLVRSSAHDVAAVSLSYNLAAPIGR